MNEITWYCSECGTDAGSKGFLYIGYAELRHRKVECWDCKDEGRNDYYMSTRELRTFKSLVEWEAHLTEKNWFAKTDWHEIVRQAAYRKAVSL